MRLLAAAALCALITITVVPPAARADDAVLAKLAGHWHCAFAGEPAVERYYSVFHPAGGGTTEYGRAETTEQDGAPVVALERIHIGGDRLEIQAFEGTGTGPVTTDALQVTGTSASGTPLTLVYTFGQDTFRRVVTDNGKTIDSEQCARVAEPPFVCTERNVPPATIHAVPPVFSANAIATRAHGRVEVLVTLDQHSRVMWTRIVKSDNHLLDAESMRAALLSTYRTRVSDCVPQAADYLFTVDFSNF